MVSLNFFLQSLVTLIYFFKTTPFHLVALEFFYHLCLKVQLKTKKNIIIRDAQFVQVYFLLLWGHKWKKNCCKEKDKVNLT
jgi:hypothetical protein